jgi:magnesium transporter
MRSVTLGETLETDQMSLFLGKSFIVTFQQYPGDCFDPVRERLRKSRGSIRRAGTDHLAYALLDAVVDAYFPVVEKYGRQLDQLDDVIDKSVSHTAVAQIHGVRQELLVLRRTVWWMRELLNSLTRDMPLIENETRVYLRDCYDHTLQLIDVIETDRELCSDLREFHYAKLTWRTNEIMKVLTGIATIFMPLSFVTGIYGMNFDTSVSPWNMPELEWYYGYPFALGLLALVATGFLTWMRSRGWFGE